MDDTRNMGPYGPGYGTGWQNGTTYAQTPQRQGNQWQNGHEQIMTQDGFKPLSREERAEAHRAMVEASFSFDGYQVVHREFFSHTYDPAMTIKGNSITFNNACINKLENVVYVQVLVNPTTSKLVIRPCAEGARDAIRWCIAKDEKRKSREITCGLFTSKIYEMMGWEQMYRYKLQGTRIIYNGEDLYVFDLTSTEIYLPATRDGADPKAKKKKRPPMLPISWRDSFGMPVEEHTAQMQIDLGDYGVADVAPANAKGTVASIGMGADMGTSMNVENNMMNGEAVRE